MGKYTEWIEHQGVKILFVRYAGLRTEEEYFKAVDEVEAEYLAQEKGHRYPMLIDVTRSILTNGVTERNKKMASNLKAAGYPDSPVAMVGLSGFQKAVVQAMQVIQKDLHIADSLDAGKDWLVMKMKAPK